MGKLYIILLLWIGVAVSSQDYYQNQFLFCLKIGTKPFHIQNNNKLPETGNVRIDGLIKKYQVVKIERWLPMADERDVVDDVALQNIYVAEFKQEKTDRELNNIIKDFRSVSEVHSADRNAIARLNTNFEPIVPNDPKFNKQWYIQKIGVDEAWGLWQDGLPGDSTVLVGVVDSGVDYQHPDLQNVLYINPNEEPGDANGDGMPGIAGVDDDGDGKIDEDTEGYEPGSPYYHPNPDDDDENGFPDDFRGWDFSTESGYYPGDNDIRPPDAGNGQILSHGTHVTGIIAATANNEVGIAGISYRSKIIATKHALDTDVDHSYILHGYSGILYCAKMGAKIINCSWGGVGSSFYEKYTIDNVANNYGAIVVCAAGNDNTDSGEGTHYPSDFENSFSVSATTSNDVRSSFSNYGHVVDISAPGSNIYSTIHANAGSYASWDGTSMASPVVAGAFALLKAWFPDKDRAWLIQTLQESADNIDEQNPNYIGKLGAGRVNIYNAIARKVLPKLTMSSEQFTVVANPSATQVQPGDTLNLSFELENIAGWQDAEDVVVTLRTSEAAITLIDTLAALGNIGNGEAVLNENDPLQFSIDPEAPFQTFEILVNISANNTSAYVFNKTIPLSITVSNNQSGFPLAEQTVTQPLAIDGFADGIRRIVAITEGKYLILYETDGSISTGFPIEVGATSAAPIVADINSDGENEIVVVTRAGKVLAYHSDGTRVFIYETKDTIYGDADAAVANLDDDPDLEIVFGSVRKNLHVIKSDSTELAGFPYTVSHIVNKGVALADLDGNNRPEIIFATFDSKLNVVTALADTLPGFPLTMNSKIVNTPVVSLIGSNPAIVVTLDDDSLFIVKADGSIQAEYAASGAILSPPALCDWQGDEQPEVFFTTEDNQVHALTLTGDVLDHFPIQLESQAETAPVFADFDNDGRYELILGTQNGWLHLIEPDGSSYPHFPAYLGEAMKETPVVVDLDMDGDTELLIGGLNDLYALDISGEHNSTSSWPTYMGNNQRTGTYSGTYTGIYNSEPEHNPQQFRLAQNYPNPFNPTTAISYQLSTAGSVNLTVYNVLGQKVRILVDKNQSAGIYHVKFDGSGLPSGIYFYRISTADFVKVRKMILMK